MNLSQYLSSTKRSRLGLFSGYFHGSWGLHRRKRTPFITCSLLVITGLVDKSACRRAELGQILHTLYNPMVAGPWLLPIYPQLALEILIHSLSLPFYHKQATREDCQIRCLLLMEPLTSQQFLLSPKLSKHPISFSPCLVTLVSLQ